MATRLAARATLRRTVYGAQRTLLREEVRMLDVAQQKAVLGAFDASPFARFDAGWSSVRRDGALPNGNVRRTDSEPRPPRSQAQIDVAAVAAALQDADGDDAEEDDDDDGYDDDEDAAEEDDASDDDDAEDDDGAGPTPEEMDAAVEVGSCGPAVAYDESRGAFEAALGERLDPLLLCDGASARYVLHELLNAGWAEGRAAALVEKLVAVGLAGLRGMEAFKSRAAGEEVRLERLNKDCWGSSYGGLTYSMTAKRLNWLRKAHAQAKSGKSNFESDLFSMLSRYETMTKNGGAGNHAAVPPDVFTMFEQWAKQKAGSAVECFASPLNHRLCDWKSRKRESILFATAFPDVDAPFGGGARFFSAAQTEAAARVDQDVSAQAAQNEAAALEDAAIESTHATADASDAATAADATRQAATASADVAPGETADAPAAAEVSGAPDMSPELARLIRNDVDHRLLVLNPPFVPNVLSDLAAALDRALAGDTCTTAVVVVPLVGRLDRESAHFRRLETHPRCLHVTELLPEYHEYSDAHEYQPSYQFTVGKTEGIMKSALFVFSNRPTMKTKNAKVLCTLLKEAWQNAKASGKNKHKRHWAEDAKPPKPRKTVKIPKTVMPKGNAPGRQSV